MNRKPLLIIAAACVMCAVTGCSPGKAGTDGTENTDDTYSVEASQPASQSTSQTQQSSQPGPQSTSFRPEVEMTEDEAACWELDDGMVYVPEYTQIMGEGEYDISADTGFFVNGDMIFSLGRGMKNGIPDYSHLAVHKADLTTGEKLQDIKEDGILNRYARTADGYVGYSLSSSPLTVILYDNAFNKVSEVDMAQLENRLKLDGVSISVSTAGECMAGPSGIIGIIMDGRLYVIDKDGTVLFSPEKPNTLSYFFKLGMTGDGSMFVWGYDNSFRTAAYYVDVKGQSLGAKLENLPQIAYDTVIYPFGSRSWYIENTSSIYMYDTVSAQCRELVTLTDYGITTDMYSGGFGVNSAGNIVVAARISPTMQSGVTYSFSAEDYSIELAEFKRIPAEDVVERKELVLGTCNDPDIQYRNRILTFNKYNTEYYISIKSYLSEAKNEIADASEASKIATQRFNLDLVSGNGADMFLFSNGDVDFANLAGKGILADLYEFIDSDEELGRDAFVPEVLSALEDDGKLFRIPEYYYTCALIGKSKYLEGYDRLSVDVLEELHSQYPDMYFSSGYNSMATLDVLIRYYMADFYSYETGECRFTSPEFIRLLELAVEFPEDNTASMASGYGEELSVYSEDKALFYLTDIKEGSNLAFAQRIFGEDITCMGYPTAQGSGIKAGVSRCFAINEASQYKEAAWDFIRELFIDNQSANITAENYESMLNAKMNMTYYIDENTIVQFDGYMTDDQKQLMRDIMTSIDGVNDYDKNIYDIIIEEAQSFLAGQKSAEDVAGVIQSRVQLYIDEKR